MEHRIDLRAADAEHLAEVLALNAAVAAMTSPLDAPALARLLAAACHAVALVEAGRASGFLIGFAPGADYASPNYRWFQDRLPRFAYVDRVVVAPWAQGRGLARTLYDDFARAAAAQGLGPMVCEVNLAPANPASDAFHAALGFTEMGRGTPQPGKTVRYLIRDPSGSRLVQR